jgi:serine/threonine protein kinase
MEAICRADYKFEPGSFDHSPSSPDSLTQPGINDNITSVGIPANTAQYWDGVSDAARDFVASCLTIDQSSRPTAEEALEHHWLSAETPHFVPDPAEEGRPTNLLPGIRKNFDARKTCE